jgi:hypothetical protein
MVPAPLGDAPVAPSVVLFTCRTDSAMLLNEAANRGGAGSTLPPLGRPSCMALPAALLHGTVASLAASGIASTPVLERASSMSSCPAQSSNPFARPWPSLQRLTLHSKNSRGVGRRRFQLSNHGPKTAKELRPGPLKRGGYSYWGRSTHWIGAANPESTSPHKLYLRISERLPSF